MNPIASAQPSQWLPYPQLEFLTGGSLDVVWFALNFSAWIGSITLCLSTQSARQHNSIWSMEGAPNGDGLRSLSLLELEDMAACPSDGVARVASPKRAVFDLSFLPYGAGLRTRSHTHQALRPLKRAFHPKATANTSMPSDWPMAAEIAIHPAWLRCGIAQWVNASVLHGHAHSAIH